MSKPFSELDADSLLDPQNWVVFRQQAHEALDVALDFVQQRQEGPVWRELPEAVKSLDAPLPAAGDNISALLTELRESLLPYTLGNTHPRFWGWVNGSGSAVNIIAQMMIAAVNANMGGRDHAPIYLERQVLQWMQQLFGLPASASGMICTGTSTATLLGLCIARQRAAGTDIRARGNDSAPGLCAYASDQAHVSVVKAMEVMGLGEQALHLVPAGDDYAMDLAALRAAIEADLAAGKRPFAVVSCVGSVNSGAIDDLSAINDLCREFGLWHHVDGAFGALCILSERQKTRLAGIEAADSIAFDFHKWMHVTYAAGCLLVADGEAHRQTFETSHAYLRGERQGIAGGAPWPNDFGIELSRGFAALAVWFQLRNHGVERLGRAIDRNCEQARALGAVIADQPRLELLAPVALNIVCFRYLVPAVASLDSLNALNRSIVVELQCRGIAAPSFTELDGKVAIRVALTNHRTRWRDLQALVDAVLALGAELA